MSAVGAAGNSTLDAYGLSFQSLLKIILTQLQYQDPLKPLDNFQFVSQLAEFAQLQQSQSLNDQITSLLTSQSSAQATGLLGKTVDVNTANNAQATPVSGVVTAVSFSGGQPALTVKTSNGQIISQISLSSIVQVR